MYQTLDKWRAVVSGDRSDGYKELGGEYGQTRPIMKALFAWGLGDALVKFGDYTTWPSLKKALLAQSEEISAAALELLGKDMEVHFFGSLGGALNQQKPLNDLTDEGVKWRIPQRIAMTRRWVQMLKEEESNK